MPDGDNTGQTNGAQNGSGDSGQQAGPKTFTQEQLEYELGLRLGRERDKTKAQLAEFEIFKGKAAKLDTLEAANQTEAEKVARAITERDARIEAAEKKATEAEQRSIGLLRQAKVTGIALALGAYDAADFAQTTAAIDPAGETADAEIKAAIEALRGSKPYLFKPAGSQLASFNPGGANGVALTDAQRVANVLNPRGGRDYGPLGR